MTSVLDWRLPFYAWYILGLMGAIQYQPYQEEILHTSSHSSNMVDMNVNTQYGYESSHQRYYRFADNASPMTTKVFLCKMMIYWCAY